MTTSTAKTIRMSATEAAQAWLKAKSVTAKKQISDFVAARAAESSRVRWTRLAKAMAEGDQARVKYYSATGEAKRAIAADLKAAKAPAKPKASPAKKAPAKKAAAKTDASSKAANLVAMLEKLDEGQMETFMTFAKLALKK